MTNLYWKTRTSTRILEPKPFKSEAEFELFIAENQEILGGDIYILHRQIRTGSKQGIADMVAVDQDSRICIIEVKNVEADESILPQALQYAIWAESNPDSLRAIWLEAKSKPETIDIDWTKLGLRVILVAPSFKSNVPGMASKLGYKIDLRAPLKTSA
jgi:RecB family endonuclease NucS